MFAEVMLAYIASLSGVILHRYTKEEISQNVKKLNLLKTVLFYVFASAFLFYSYKDVNVWIMLLSVLIMFFINYLPQRINWKLDTRSFIDMCLQNVPMGFALSLNTVPLMFAYYISESSLFSRGNKFKDSISVSALSQIPLVLSAVINSVYAVPVSVTAGLIIFLVIKKSIILKEIWNEKQ